MIDLGGATLLIGTRDNDLKGRSSDNLAYLGAVHGDPNNQDEHCLRSAGQDEPGGSAAAVAACRAYIRGRVAEALDGLGANGAPDLAGGPRCPCTWRSGDGSTPCSPPTTSASARPSTRWTTPSRTPTGPPTA